MANPKESEDSEGGEGGGMSLRIDRWLWCTRLFKSRSLAAEAVAGGKVHVNGRRVKPAHGGPRGRPVTITRPGYEFECEVLKLPDRRGFGAHRAGLLRGNRRGARGAREIRRAGAPGRGLRAAAPLERPDKHGRRVLRRLRGRTEENDADHGSRANRLFIFLAGFFLTNALIGEFVGVKIFALEATLGAPPFNWSLFGINGTLNFTAGVIVWPFVFIMTDVINEYFGVRGVRLISWIAVGLIAYAFLAAYAAISLAPATFWVDINKGMGVPDIQKA